MSEAEDDDKVGYGRPPKRTRFQKGRSGNPKGRPKGAKGFSASLRRELDSQVMVREGDRQIRISKGEAAAKRLVAKALGGDMPALKMLAALEFESHRARETTLDDALAAETPEPLDHEILRHYFSRAADPGELVEDGEAEDDCS